MAFSTSYKDDILNSDVNTRRKYTMIENSDGTYSFVDVTDYSQVGDVFNAALLNSITEFLNTALTTSNVVNSLTSTSTKLPVSANQANILNGKIADAITTASNALTNYKNTISKQTSITIDISDSDISSAVSGTCKYIPHLEMVFMTASFTISGLEGGDSGSNLVLGNIPSAYRPSRIIALPCYGNIAGEGKLPMAYIGSSGNIAIRMIGDSGITTVHVAGFWFV